MKVLVVGSGAREHALVWKALQSPLTDAVYCAPGNAATAAIAVNCDVAATDAAGLARLVLARGVDLTIIGPDAAIAAGVADAVGAQGGLVFGPTAAAGRIESSKAFAKDLLRRAGVATPAFWIFDEATAAKDFVRREGRPFVVKADGLAKGKGTFVPSDVEGTLDAIDTLMVARAVGSAASRIVLEERIEGREVSLLALVDGERALPLVPACDYKRALDGDRGPNTGGMGGYSPPGFFNDEDAQRACRQVIEPTLAALREAGTPYRGCLYAGLMVKDGAVQVLEFNARFGDPEAQVILPRLDADLMPALAAAARGDLGGVTLGWRAEASVAVVLVSAGYPGTFETGHPISGLSSLEPNVYAFHGGTAASAAGYETAGGRVLTVVALGPDVGAARERAYRNAERVRFDGVRFRRDIAEREVSASVMS
ncbi:MAG TPA: phosphoribosylamine--glycine ligase [Candidatus Limnocylindrales bacterium]|nr:phosphoribosylamine--glycine ligase [Candidatus Limnocylindrales bacterium]